MCTERAGKVDKMLLLQKLQYLGGKHRKNLIFHYHCNDIIGLYLFKFI